MKLEKISDNQIRCILNKDDLLNRELRISELAYGTEKAKALFHDMMQQASYEFGFETENFPLMIEATPISADCLILLITKVEDPDELDTRFSKFTSSSQDETDLEEDENQNAFADEIIHCFDQLNELLDGAATDSVDGTNNQNDFISLPEALKAVKQKKEQEKMFPNAVTTQTNLIKIFSMTSLEDMICLAKHLPFYKGKNSIYKDQRTSKFYLVLNKSSHTPEEFNKICNIASEFAKTERSTYASLTYYEEQFTTILKNKAMQVLCSL